MVVENNVVKYMNDVFGSSEKHDTIRHFNCEVLWWRKNPKVPLH